jgi:hypothetical protein
LRITHPFEFLFHGSCHVDGFLVDHFDGKDPALVDSYRAVNGRISKVRFRIRAERHLARSQKRMQTLLMRSQMQSQFHSDAVLFLFYIQTANV